MASKQYEQFDFSVGEVAPDHIMRADSPARTRSLRSARNCRLLASGGIESRGGTVKVDELEGDGIVQAVTVAGDVFYLVFTANRVDVFDTDRLPVDAIGSLTWGASIVHDLCIAPHGDVTFVFHETIRPIEIQRLADGTWVANEHLYDVGPGGTIAMPFYRFAAKGVTLTPSAIGGTITLEASAPYFVAEHVDIRLRLQGREVQIFTFVDSTHVTAGCVQGLYETQILPVTSSSGFAVGEVVTGQDSTATGEIVAIPDGTHITILRTNYTEFDATEKIVGPNFVTTATAVVAVTTPAAVLEWTEVAISDLRGWPGAGAVHRGRLWLTQLTAIPFGIIGSATNALNDFEPGAEPDDAIFELLGDESAGKIQHVVSAEQLLLLTSRRAYYYPETENNPIQPDTFQLLQIGPDGASACRPVAISEGVLFAETAGGSVLGAFPTGDIRRSWRTADMSRLATHIVNTPRSMAYVTGSPDDPERYVYVVNDDGSLAVVSYSESEGDAVPGWTPWDTTGEFRSVSGLDGEVWAVVKRTFDAIDYYTLEVFDEDALLDGQVVIDAGDLIGPVTPPDVGDPDEVIETPSGPMFADFVYRYAAYANATCSLVVGGDYIGEVTLDADGDFGVPDLAGTILLGFKFECVAQPWPPMDAEDQRARRRRRRITRAGVRYQGKGISVDGTLRPLYQGDEDTSAAAPERDELWWWPCFGWSYEPDVQVQKLYAAPWRVLGIVMEVTG